METPKEFRPNTTWPYREKKTGKGSKNPKEELVFADATAAAFSPVQPLLWNESNKARTHQGASTKPHNHGYPVQHRESSRRDKELKLGCSRPERPWKIKGEGKVGLRTYPMIWWWSWANPISSPSSCSPHLIPTPSWSLVDGINSTRGSWFRISDLRVSVEAVE